MNMKILSASFLLLICCLALPAGDFFTPDTATIRKIAEDRRMKKLFHQAEQTLKAKPLPADRTVEKGTDYGLYVYYVGRTLTKWMESLGYSYMVTKNERYAGKAVELLTATCRDFPVAHPRIARGMPEEYGQVLYGIAIGCQFFSDHLTPAQKELVEKTAGGYIDAAIKAFDNPNAWYYEIHNHNGVVFGPAGIVCLQFRDRPEYGRRMKECLRFLKRWLETSIDEKGLPAEGSAYARYSTLRVMLFAMLLREKGGEDLFKTTRLGKWPHVYIAKQIPGTRWMDTRGDGYYEQPGLECLYVAVANQDPAAEWIWENYAAHGEEAYFPIDILLEAGKRPAPALDFSKCRKAEFFPRRQFAIWRTGWSKDDVMFSMEAGPFITSSKGKGCTHAQADKGHFCLYAFGEMWAVDTGYANDIWTNRKYSRSHTFAHSCVLINGKGQAPSGNNLGVSAGTPVFEDHAAYGYAKADCTPAYRANNRKEPGAGAKHAVRDVLFARPSHGAPAYAVILDNIEKDGEKHKFTWQMMLPGNKQVKLRPGGALILSETSFPVVATTPADAEKGAAIWNVEFKNPTTCSIWGLFRAGGKFIPESDSFYLQIDEEKPFRWDFGDSTIPWSWTLITQKVNPKVMYQGLQRAKRFNFSEGSHSIRLMTREREAEVKALFLGETPDATPFSGKGRFLAVEHAGISGGMVKRQASEAHSGNRCAVFLNAAAPVKMRLDTFCPLNPRPPAVIPRLRGDAECVNPYFAALLVPLKKEMCEPQVSFDRTQPDKVIITVRWETTVDTITWHTGKDGRTDFRRRAL